MTWRGKKVTHFFFKRKTRFFKYFIEQFFTRKGWKKMQTKLENKLVSNNKTDVNNNKPLPQSN